MTVWGIRVLLTLEGGVWRLPEKETGASNADSCCTKSISNRNLWMQNKKCSRIAHESYDEVIDDDIEMYHASGAVA